MLSLKTPTYSGRSFLQSRLEGLEYAVLFSVIANSRQILHFLTPESEQKHIIFNWGRMWILIDDMQDEMKGLVSNADIKNILIGSNYSFKVKHPLLIDLINSAKFVNDRVSQRSYLKQYLQFSVECFDNQLSMTKLRKRSDLIKETLASAEKKGGAFLLSLMYTLNPSYIPEKIAKAIFIGGSWGQAIDDFADREKDKKNSVFTIFSSTSHPDKVLDNLAYRYEKTIFSLIKKKNFIIPLARDLTALAKSSRMQLFSSIFRTLNK